MEIVLNERDCKTPFVAQRRVHIAVIFVIRVRTAASSDRFSLSGDEEVMKSIDILLACRELASGETKEVIHSCLDSAMTFSLHMSFDLREKLIGVVDSKKSISGILGRESDEGKCVEDALKRKVRNDEASTEALDPLGSKLEPSIDAFSYSMIGSISGVYRGIPARIGDIRASTRIRAANSVRTRKKDRGIIVECLGCQSTTPQKLDRIRSSPITSMAVTFYMYPATWYISQLIAASEAISINPGLQHVDDVGDREDSKMQLNTREDRRIIGLEEELVAE
ncbi:hypothetical protein PCH_Pc18g06140 [Penicillium rubens Wisconsin 54-1255]|uniref:Uncharacterized protein n=1 Tax=Penicillium rubens (strain ATCC 28089 / DSM 1075 / NRRL 1951 / Wisconsin 54-1255) TaxID=500485 RepID=B6HCJ1_PENRW|nr:hypothetical protein PCH_Pc18g06140 [Penicillium rubens Wisconsin 54-1255]